MTPEQSAEAIFRLLHATQSVDADQRRKAESQLRQAEEEPDFFASLAGIAAASDAEAPPNIRFLAAVTGKNAFGRSWKRAVKKNHVTDDERNHVRAVLLGALGEQHSIVATQISVWISLIARADFPKDWPTLMPSLAEAIRSQNIAVVKHAVTTLDMVLKQLASRRLLSHRSALYQQSPELFAFLYQLFVHHLNYILQNTDNPQGIQQQFDIVVRCMKSLRRIMSYGCRSLLDLPQVPNVLGKLVELPNVFMIGAKGGAEIPVRFSLLAAKLVRHAQERHPLDFQRYLATFLPLFYDTIVGFRPGVSCDRTCAQSAFFLRNVATCAHYGINSLTIEQHKKMKAENRIPSPDEPHEHVRYIVLSFFDEKRVDVFIQSIITNIFVLSPREQELWSSDPEALVREEDAVEWGTENLRAHCDRLFKLLLIRDKPRIVPMILQLVDSVPNDNPLLLDACFRAVGRAVYDIQGAFDFEVWLRGRLGAVLQADCSENVLDRVIQARTTWLVAQFVQQITRDSRIAIYPMLVKLLSYLDRDRVIALTAAKAIQTLVDDMGFHPEDFTPYLEGSLRYCFELIHTSEAFETKRDLLNTVSVLISKSTTAQVIQRMDLIASAIPEMWEECGETTTTTPSKFAEYGVGKSGENLMRAAIVDLLNVLLLRLGATWFQSVELRSILFPILAFAIDMAPGRGGGFMLDEGCTLWSTVVSMSTEYHQELRQLYPQTHKILELDFDHLREMFSIMENYVLLGGVEFMREYGGIVNKTLLNAFQAARDRGHIAGADILHTVLQAFPQESVRFSGEILVKLLERVLLREQSSVVATAYLSVLCRAAILNIGDLESLVLGGSEENCIRLMDVAMESLDNVSGKMRQKLVVTALCGMTTRYWKSQAAQERLPGVLNAAIQVLSEESGKQQKRMGQVQYEDDFMTRLAKYGEKEEGIVINEDAKFPTAPQVERRRRLEEGDVCRKPMKEICKNMLTAIQESDLQRFNLAMGRTDDVLKAQLQRLLEDRAGNR